MIGRHQLSRMDHSHPTSSIRVLGVSSAYPPKGNVRELKHHADRRGFLTKTRTLTSGEIVEGRPFTRGRLYHLLSNPIYIGKIQHNIDRYEGVHEAIIDEALWTRVQDRLQQNRVERKSRSNARNPSPLAGKVFDQSGHPLTPEHSNKKGHRYRYYVSSTQGIRLPALGLEAATRQALDDDRELTLHLQRAERDDTDRLTLVERVMLQDGSILINLNDGVHPDTIESSFTLRKRGIEQKLVLASGPIYGPDLTLIKRILRAMTWLDQIKLGCTISEIANGENVTPEYITHNLGLGFLSPRVLKAIASGKQRPDISSYRLSKKTIPIDWNEQAPIFLELN